MDKFDLCETSKEFAIGKLKTAKESKYDNIMEYTLDYNTMYYKNERGDQNLKQGEIIKVGTSYFIYLGHSKPRNWPPSLLTHHIMDEKGERFKWKLGVNLPIEKVNC